MKKRAFLFLAAAFVLLVVTCNKAVSEQTATQTVEDYQARGLEYLNNGDYDMAITDYEAALQLDPNDTFAQQRLENARQARGW